VLNLSPMIVPLSPARPDQRGDAHAGSRRAEPIVPVGFERIRGETVIGINGGGSAAGEIGLITRVFDMLAAQAIHFFGASSQLIADWQATSSVRGVTISTSRLLIASSRPRPARVWQRGTSRSGGRSVGQT
jgi:hypothetical protein